MHPYVCMFYNPNVLTDCHEVYYEVTNTERGQPSFILSHVGPLIHVKLRFLKSGLSFVTV